MKAAKQQAKQKQNINNEIQSHFAPQ